MDRLACISVPHLPLQIALRVPGNRGGPLALVKEDKPTSPILEMNRAAADQGLRPGMRYGEALSIVSDLNAVVVSSRELDQAQQEIREVLAQWSPRIEACPFDRGGFWIDASRLSGLYGSETQWGTSVRQALTQKNFRAVVVVGWTREGTYVLARSRQRSTVISSREAEKRALEAAPLSVFPLSLRTRRLLERLGIRTMVGLSKIPAQELSRRLGPEMVRELRQMQTLASLPLQTADQPPEPTLGRRLESPVADVQTLLSVLAELLQEALVPLQRRARLMAVLRFVCVLESQTLLSETLRPAEATSNLPSLLRLVELRLSSMSFSTGVVEIRICWEDGRPPASSGELFAPPVVRDKRRGAEAIALIRAKWGNEAVVRPVLTDSHVPERSFRWEPVEQLTPPSPQDVGTEPMTAIRRVERERTDPRGFPAGQRLAGPFLLAVASGGSGGNLDREYWFLRNSQKEVQWISRDRLTGVPRLEGLVD